jgi:hypothetical protein
MVFSVRESNNEPGQQKRKKLAWKFFVEFMLAGDSTKRSTGRSCMRALSETRASGTL